MMKINTFAKGLLFLLGTSFAVNEIGRAHV